MVNPKSIKKHLIKINFIKNKTYEQNQRTKNDTI